MIRELPALKLGAPAVTEGAALAHTVYSIAIPTNLAGKSPQWCVVAHDYTGAFFNIRAGGSPVLPENIGPRLFFGGIIIRTRGFTHIDWSSNSSGRRMSVAPLENESLLPWEAHPYQGVIGPFTVAADSLTTAVVGAGDPQLIAIPNDSSGTRARRILITVSSTGCCIMPMQAGDTPDWTQMMTTGSWGVLLLDVSGYTHMGMQAPTSDSTVTMTPVESS